jgi:SAM-dependent methyltransferase
VTSYIRFNRSLLFEWSRLFHAEQAAQDAASFVQWRTGLAIQHMRDACNVEWRNQRLLEIGCGQKLAYSLYFAQRNQVVGIDTEPPFHKPYLRSFLELLRYAGPYRTLKTAANALLGTRSRYERALSEATGFKGRYDLQVVRMNSLKLDFPDGHFDGVFSFSVFEHISDPKRALEEVKRVLKPGGVFYLDLHLYTAIHGDHDPRSFGSGTAVQPWNHLRPSCAASRLESCYVNKVRLADWRRMLESTFDDLQFRTIDGEIDRTRSHLTDDVRRELSDYSDEELLTTTVIAVVRQGKPHPPSTPAPPRHRADVAAAAGPSALR